MYVLCVFCVVIIVLCFLSSEAVIESPDSFNFVFECNYTTRCEGLFGFSDCRNGQCECRNEFYFTSKLDPIEFRKRIFCHICPSFGERCDESNCCRHSEYVACIDGLCRCRDSSMDSCLHFEPNTELMIAAKLALFGIILVSLAILLMVLRRSCGGEDFNSPSSAYRRDRIYASLNSIQRFVLAKMQDRPPPYDELEPSSKPPPYSVTLSTQESYGYEAPPPYSVFAQASSSNEYPGISNPIFTAETPDLDHATILPITLPSSASAVASHPCEGDSQAEEGDLSDLKRPVLTGATARRMSNYSTFVTQPDPDLTLASTSALCHDILPKIWKTDTSTESSSGLNAGPSFNSGSGSENSFPIPNSVPSHCLTEPFDPNSGSKPCFGSSHCVLQETVVDWSGREVVDHEIQTTDLPFSESGTSEDWLASTLGPVVQQPWTSRPLSSDHSKNLGNLENICILRQDFSGSECSEPMSFAHDSCTYSYDDDVYSLVSHLHPVSEQTSQALDSQHAAEMDHDSKS